MSLLQQMRERRVLPLMGAYMVSGFVVLEGVDQLVSYEIISAVWYRVALVLYLFGAPGSITIAWFHGAKGAQKFPKTEIVIQSVLVVLALTTAWFVFQGQRRATELAAASASSGLSASSIAVLYFLDLSPSEELSYVADGLTEALIDQLSGVRSLDVVSRNGVLPYRDADVTPDSIARALGVGSLIRGSVEKEGDQLRITTQLVDGLSGAVIERRTFAIPAGQFLAARDSLALTVSEVLRQRIGEEVRLRERRAGTQIDEAWSLVQRSERLRQQAEHQQADGETEAALRTLAEMDSLLAQAETVDPSWVRPTARRAHTAFRGAFFLVTGPGDYDEAAVEIERGLVLAERAVELDPRDADALEQRGALKYLLWLMEFTVDQDEADRLLADARSDLEAAADADPDRASVYSLLSHLYLRMDEDVSVILAARKAYEADAYLEDADRIIRRLFWAHYNLEQIRDARIWCDEGASRYPDNYHFTECRLWLMMSAAEDVDVEEAWEAQVRLDSLAPDEYERRLGRLLVGGVLLRANQLDSAEAVFATGQSDEEIDPSSELIMQEAAIRSATGDPDKAVELLRLYFAATNTAFDPEESLHWWYKSLVGRPEFEALPGR
jgi:serine/threonine-protein kinase